MRLRLAKDYSKITRWILLLILFPVSWSAEEKQLLPVLSARLTFLHQPKWREIPFWHLLCTKRVGTNWCRTPIPQRSNPRPARAYVSLFRGPTWATGKPLAGTRATAQ